MSCDKLTGFLDQLSIKITRSWKKSTTQCSLFNHCPSSTKSVPLRIRAALLCPLSDGNYSRQQHEWFMPVVWQKGQSFDIADDMGMSRWKMHWVCVRLDSAQRKGFTRCRGFRWHLSHFVLYSNCSPRLTAFPNCCRPHHSASLSTEARVKNEWSFVFSFSISGDRWEVYASSVASLFMHIDQADKTSCSEVCLVNHSGGN